MTAPAAIRKSDMDRAAAMAKKHGCVVEIEKDGVKYRFMPDTPNIHSAHEVDQASSPASNGLAAWRARHEGRPRGNPSR